MRPAAGVALVEEAAKERRLAGTLRIRFLHGVVMAALALHFVIVNTMIMFPIQFTERSFTMFQAALLRACVMHLVVVLDRAGGIVVVVLRHLLVVRLFAVVHPIAVGGLGAHHLPVQLCRSSVIQMLCRLFLSSKS